MVFSEKSLETAHTFSRRKYHPLEKQSNKRLFAKGQPIIHKAYNGLFLHISLPWAQRACLMIEYLEDADGLIASLIKLNFKFETNDKITSLRGPATPVDWRHCPQLIFRIRIDEMYL